MIAAELESLPGVLGETEQEPAPDTAVQDNSWSALVRDAADIVQEELPPLVQIVEGIVAEHSKLVIGSGSKSFKTWLTMDLGLSIAHGVSFLDRATARRRVLYVNLELKPPTFMRRLQAIAIAKGIKVERESFLHLPLRGEMAGVTVRNLVDRIIRVARHFRAEVIIADPVYKMNVEGDENSSLAQTLFFNQLDRITTEGRCTLILNDHFGKGNQSEKEPLDAIRGSSAKGGDVDAAMVLRKHEVEGCLRVDLVHRELPPAEPFCIGWDFPLMHLRKDLSPDAMKKSKAGRHKTLDPRNLLGFILNTSSEKATSISRWAKDASVPRATMAQYVSDMRAEGWVRTTGEGSSVRQYITEEGKKVAQRAKDNP